VAGEPELIEFGGAPEGTDPRPARPISVAVLAAVAGLVLGFLIGQRHATTPAPAPAVPSAPAATVFQDAVIGTGHTCSTTLPGPGGHDDLQLGVEISNRASIPVTLRDARISLPLGGLQVAGDPMLQACGELTNPTALVSQILLPGQSTWYSVRLTVPGGKCPAALPVLFEIDYRYDTKVLPADVGGFDDLGSVPYPSCTGE
jgi:hypothetical protein